MSETHFLLESVLAEDMYGKRSKNRKVGSGISRSTNELDRQ